MPTTEQLLRLPKWAQAEIRRLTQQRDAAVTTLFEYEDNQTPSKVWSEDIICLPNPSLVKNYFQTHEVTVEHAGVRLSVRGLYNDKMPMSLTWRPAGDGWAHGDVAFIPESYQQARLVAMEKS